jgi:hypothetical protein
MKQKNRGTNKLLNMLTKNNYFSLFRSRRIRSVQGVNSSDQLEPETGKSTETQKSVNTSNINSGDNSDTRQLA